MASGIDTVDCVVVGAGPAGATAARLLCTRGARVVLLEKGTLGRDKPCGGGLTARAVAELDIAALDGLVRGSCNAALVRHGSGHRTRVELSQPLLLVRRCEWDRALTESAARAGATVRTQEPARAVDTSDSSVLSISTDHGSLRARTLLIATGAESPLRAAAGFAPPPTRMMVALEIEAEGSVAGADQNLFTFDYDVPHGYAWAFPKGEMWNVGICSADRRVGPHLRLRLDHFVADMGLRFRDGAHARATGRRIPCSIGGAQIASGRAALLGDAAGLADPLLGEGIGEALASARLAADAVMAVLAGESKDLLPYSHAVRHSLGPHLRRTRWAARAVFARPGVAVSLIGHFSPARSIARTLTEESFREAKPAPMRTPPRISRPGCPARSTVAPPIDCAYPPPKVVSRPP